MSLKIKTNKYLHTSYVMEIKVPICKLSDKIKKHAPVFICKYCKGIYSKRLSKKGLSCIVLEGN